MALTINGTTFDGHPSGSGNQVAWLPTGITPAEQKIGATLVAASGARNRVERNVIKRVWTISWEATNQATMQTVRTIARLMTTFTLVDLEGVSYTVQTEDEFAPEFAYTSAAGVNHWNVELTLYQV
jgi:hypothetical protein